MTGVRNAAIVALLALAVWALPGGGTAAEVLRRTECDLLVVKPAGFVSLVMVTE